MNFDWSVIWAHRGDLAEGASLTIFLTVLTMLFAVPIGILLALMRISKSRVLSTASACFVEFFRNLPLIMVIYWAFYVMPVLLDIQFSAFTTALVALTMNISAYNAETMRAGINSIRKGQYEAAISIGMSSWQAMRYIVLPQAARRVLPVFASTWVSLFKDTSLVSVIAVGELAHVAMQIRSQTFRVLEMLTAMALIYWMLGYPQAKLVDWINRRFAVKE